MSELLEWERGIEDPCKKCGGSGYIWYGSTSTYWGGVGGSAITKGVCDKCWGSGEENRPWPSHKEFFTMKKEEHETFITSTSNASHTNANVVVEANSLSHEDQLLVQQGRVRQADTSVSASTGGAAGQEAPDKVTIREVFVENPPGWFRKVGDGPWESVSLAPYNGMLPVVWMKPGNNIQQRETWVDPRAVASRSTPAAAQTDEMNVIQARDWCDKHRHHPVIGPMIQALQSYKPTSLALIVAHIFNLRSLSATGETPRKEVMPSESRLGKTSSDLAGDAHPQKHAPSERTLDEERPEQLLGRIRKAIAEHNQKGTYACSLWTEHADSDGCGICFSCMAEDLREFTEAWLAARGKETRK